MYNRGFVAPDGAASGGQVVGLASVPVKTCPTRESRWSRVNRVMAVVILDSHCGQYLYTTVHTRVINKG